MRRWQAALAWGVAAVVSALAGQRTWAHDGVLAVTGADATGGLVTTIAWTCVALALLLLVLRRRGTLAVGVIAILIGAGVVVAALTSTYPAQALGEAAAAQVRASGWRHAFAAGGALTLVGGVIALVTAGQASRRRSERYQRGTAEADPDTRDLWKAMDAGDDPTADPR